MKLNIYYLIEKIINKKQNIQLSKNKDIKKIFDIKKGSLDFSTCDYTRIQLKHSMLLYNIYNKDIEYAYHYILNQIASLIKEIKPNPTLPEILYIYTYLLYNGYLSYDNKFTFTFPNKELEIRKGFSVFSGKAVCRNMASLLSDILSYLDINNFGIITYRTDENTETKNSVDENLYNIYNESSSNFDEELQNRHRNVDELFTGNHFEVIAEVNNKLYILDPSSLRIYQIVEKNTGYPVLDNLRLWYLYCSGEQTLKFTSSIYHLLKNKHVKLCNCDHIIKIQKACYDTCEKNKQKILKFRKDIDEDIKFIHESIQTLPEK